MNSFNTPIVLIIYKRKQSLLKIIEELRKINASKIYVIADGPNSEKDIPQINEARSAIDTIDWKTNITRIYSEANLGIYNNVTKGLDFVFSNEENAIILEDDCIPNNSFFTFVEEMLTRYKNSSKIALVSGTNLDLNLPFNYDYDFVYYPLIWGWATWKKSWQEFRTTIPMIKDKRDKERINSLFNNPASSFHWNKLFENINLGKQSNWDHELTYYLFNTRKLCIIPRLNMVSNHGIDKEATHTTSISNRFFTSLNDYYLPLIHPIKIEENDEINYTIEKELFGGGLRSFVSYLIQVLLNVFR
jgi:hypothetical protein